MSRFPIPTEPVHLTPEWLTWALREGGGIGQAEVTGAEWEIIGQEWGFTGVIARVRLRYARDAEAGPRSLIAKLPMARRPSPSIYREARTRDPAMSRRYAERCAREVWFYQQIAPGGGTAAPHLYYSAAALAEGQVVLLLEDMASSRVGDVVAGCSPGDAGLVIETIAAFHGAWWERSRPDALSWLPRWESNQQSRQQRYAQLVDPFLERFGGWLAPGAREAVLRLRSGLGAVLAELAAAPETLIHADLHLDNVLFHPPGGARPISIIDWQSVMVGPAVLDLNHMLFASLDAESRRAAEDDLIRRYHEALLERGVTGYGGDRLRHHCRLALLSSLAGMVIWLGSVDLDGLAGRELQLVQSAIKPGRVFAAVCDHHVVELLPPA